MTFTEFIRTKELFDNGSMESIRNADLDAFLFENKWYPVRQFVAFIHQGINNQEAIKKLVLLIPYLRIKENVDFRGSNLPISITPEEKLVETRYALLRVNDLSYN
jgi:hypothetical protein